MNQSEPAYSESTIEAVLDFMEMGSDPELFEVITRMLSTHKLRRLICESLFTTPGSAEAFNKFIG